MLDSVSVVVVKRKGIKKKGEPLKQLSSQPVLEPCPIRERSDCPLFLIGRSRLLVQ